MMWYYFGGSYYVGVGGLLIIEKKGLGRSL